MKTKNTKILIGGGVVGVVLLGILTNALWDALKPLTRMCLRGLLNLSILGIDKFKNGIYQEIARGFHESLSLELFIFFHAFFISFVVVSCVAMLIFKKKIFGIKKNTPNDDEEDNEISKRPFNFMKKPAFVWFTVAYVIFAGTIISLDLIKQNYINNAISHYEQMMKVIGPDISSEQEKSFRSSFSQINNKVDYVNLINTLEDKAKETKKKIPEFNFVF